MINVIENTNPELGKTTLNENPNLVQVEIPYHDPQWLDFRYGGIPGIYEGGWGASESGLLFPSQDNPENYRPVLPELMQWKAGINIPTRRVTKQMLRGIMFESVVLDYWRMWDGTDFGYLDKYLANEKMRDFGLVKSYIYNKRFPWLFCSLDAYIKKGQANLLTGALLELHSPLEAKTVGFYASKNNKYPLPLKYTYQAQQQMLITETDYLEFAVIDMKDDFSVIPMEMDPGICEHILLKSRECWNTILQLREMKSEKDKLIQSGSWGLVEKVDAEMQSILPLPGEGEAYSEYYSDSYLKTADVVKGSLEQFDLARKHLVLGELIKRYESRQGGYDNLLKDSFVKSKAEFIDFDSLGKLRYFKKEGGKNFQLSFSGIKEKPDSVLIDEIFDKQIELITHLE